MYKLTIFLFVLLFTVACGGDAENLKVNDKAPGFELIDAYGNTHALSDYNGKSPVVLYFYPKANTSGCTKQACGIRDDLSKFKENNIQVFGVSTDEPEALKEFIDDYDLNFTLLSDADKKVTEAYGVLNSIGFANRVTFIIDKKGNIAHIIRNVDVTTHSNEVFKLAKEL